MTKDEKDKLFDDMVGCGMVIAKVEAEAERKRDMELKRLDPVEVFPGLKVK